MRHLYIFYTLYVHTDYVSREVSWTLSPFNLEDGLAPAVMGVMGSGHGKYPRLNQPLLKCPPETGL